MNGSTKQSVKPRLKQTANPFPGSHNQSFNELGYTVELTRDDSPTLRLKPTDEEIRTQRMSEAMHHSGGAALESWYIYGDVIGKVFQNASKIEPIKVCSVGLGLGYIEMIWALCAVHHKQKVQSSIQIDSFEIDPGLVSFFLSWIRQENKVSSAVYDLAFQKLVEANPLFSAHLKVEVQNLLSSSLSQNFCLHKNVRDFKKTKRWDVVCYDAFSKKFSEDIWREDFLNEFLKNHCSDDCVFTTYAYTAELRRVLEQHNFIFIERPGFCNKRKSTLAVRGFTTTFELQTRYSR
ncbi:MAG: hypothetical protein H7256_15370 [Bdellovibrio sp.]|nr:hypothetical protein [Bdellovibrio sp.]